MKVALDTSAIIAVIANEPEKEKIVKLTKGVTLLAPYSVYWEIGNAFSAMLKRQRTSFEKVIEAIRIFETIPIHFVDVELEESLKIATEIDGYCYDAYLLRCAQKYQAFLLTLDKKLYESAKDMKINVIEVK